METHIVIMAGEMEVPLPSMNTPESSGMFREAVQGSKNPIQPTMEYFRGLCLPDHIWIVISGKHRDMARKQLPSVPPHHILGEPVARNTTPGIAYACWKIKKRHPDANVVVAPADIPVTDTEEFRRVIAKALLVTYRSNAIVTIGIQPYTTETGYGYIAAGEALDNEIRKADEYRGANNFNAAGQSQENKYYFQSTGISVWNVKTMETAIRRHAPYTAEIFDRIYPELYTGKEKEIIEKWFPACESISLDDAVLEKAEQMYVMPLNFGQRQTPQQNLNRINNGHSSGF